jgi:SAM-dependent methyltransferase
MIGDKRRFFEIVQLVRHSPPVNQLRYHAYKTALSFPRRHECNLCGWTGRRFLTHLHRHVLCPRCGSQVRHRLIAAALVHAPHLTQGAVVDGSRILHFSAEDCLESTLRPRARLYVKADLPADRVNIRGDMTHMPFRDGAFDALISCDVLEHIVDDRAAVAEIHRVLRPNGVAILTVPTFDDRDTTCEDPSVDTPDRRAVAYGQSDHVRNYGAGDFAARLASAGFTVSVVDAGCFSPKLVRRHVLFPPTLRQSPHGWNNRRVFFARA